MQDANTAAAAAIDEKEASPDKPAKVVSTHVLVAEGKVEKLRELSRKTRVAQSEYLREAVDDLLLKYLHGDKEE
ncbi:MAG: ribbon-helix-helix domain-containing protein [Myxococcales bacterium]|nr:ribbon-helix-helix domain-containing protein [Myxococcales bacterium]